MVTVFSLILLIIISAQTLSNGGGGDVIVQKHHITFSTLEVIITLLAIQMHVWE